jgi:hypothetical protein
MATAHSYLRYSCPEQALGDSERRQIENARQWAAANGHDYDDSYRDPGISAFQKTCVYGQALDYAKQAPGRALNRPTWSPVKGSSASVSPNRLSYGCPTRIFLDPRNRHHIVAPSPRQPALERGA